MARPKGVYNTGTVDVRNNGELDITSPDYSGVGIFDYDGEVILSGNVNIRTTGYRCTGIKMYTDGNLYIKDGANIQINQSGGSDWGILSKNVHMSGGNVTIGSGDAQYSGNFEFRGIFTMSGGTITSNKTNGLYNGGSLIMTGGHIDANPNVSNAFYNGWYSSITFLDKKNAVSGPISYDSTVDGSSAGFQTYYGTILDFYDAETGYPIDFTIEDTNSPFYTAYDYNGMKLVPISANSTEISFSIQGYESGPYVFEPLTDSQQVRNIYLKPYRPRTANPDHLIISKGSTETIEITLGKYSNASDYATIESTNESVAAVSHDRLDQDGQITVTAINSGYANIKVSFKGGSYDSTSYVSVYIPYDCSIETVNKPADAFIDGTNIKASVPFYVSMQEIDVTVSSGATWKLYSDVNCQYVINNKQIALSVGDNTAYIKVTSENWDTKIYAITISRAASTTITDGGGSSGGGGGSGGGGSWNSSPTPTPQNTPKPVTSATATAAVNAALQAMKSGGGSSASARMKNPSTISLEILQAMVKAAGATPLKINADSMTEDGKAVDVRISFNPANATKAVDFSISTTSMRAQSTKASFEKWFNNNISVLVARKRTTSA